MPETTFHPGLVSEPSARVVELDALRGIASATVVWHHWIYIFPTVSVPWFIVPLIAGREAVILFFVLSGYVLSLPLWRGRPGPYRAYAARRIGRIYLPYLGAAAIPAVGCFFLGGSHLPLAPWFYKTWQTPLTARMLLSQALMSPKPLLNIAFWSLSFEMAISFLFPILGWALFRTGRYSGWVALFGVKWLGNRLAAMGYGGSFPEAMLYYMVFFLLGACVARERRVLMQILGWARTPWLWAGLAISLAAYYNYWLVQTNAHRGEFVTAVGSAMLILLIQDPRTHLWLRTRPARFLGRISYSLYLVHGTVLYVLLILLYGHLPKPLLGTLYGICGFGFAYVFCITVEEPFHRLGKRLAAHLERQSGREVPQHPTTARMDVP